MKLTKIDKLAFDYFAKELNAKDFKMLSNQEISIGTGITHHSQIRRTIDRLLNQELIVKKSGQNFNMFKLTNEGEQLISNQQKPTLETPILDEDETFYNHQILLVYNYLQQLTKKPTVGRLDLISIKVRNLIKDMLRDNDRDTILNIIDLKFKEWNDKPHFRKNLTAKTLFKPDLFYKYKQQLENKKKYEDYPTKRYLPKPVRELQMEVVHKQSKLMGADDSIVYPICVKLYKTGFRRWQFFHNNLFTKEWQEKFLKEFYPKGKPEKEEHLFLTKRNYR